jgi:SM-20-related protein
MDKISMDLIIKEEKNSEIIQHLVEDGYAIIPDFMNGEAVATLRQEAESLWRENNFAQAAVGRGAARQQQTEIRADFVHWLSAPELTPVQKRYWNAIDALRLLFNQTFFLNLRDFEAHLAIYPPGAFYKRHLDQHRQTQRRQITCILYLNENWQQEDGGELRIYPETGKWTHHLDTAPIGGTLVCFRSDALYHEVLPAQKQRYSLTGWLCREENPFF